MNIPLRHSDEVGFMFNIPLRHSDEVGLMNIPLRHSDEVGFKLNIPLRRYSNILTRLSQFHMLRNILESNNAILNYLTKRIFKKL